MRQVGLDHPVRGDDRGGRARQPAVHHRVAVHEEVPQHRALSPHQPLNEVASTIEHEIRVINASNVTETSWWPGSSSPPPSTRR